jgi:hypothetical protein
VTDKVPMVAILRMARAGYEMAVQRAQVKGALATKDWEGETPALRADWIAIVRAILRASP